MKQRSQKRPRPFFRQIRLERVSDKVANQLKKAISDGVFRVGDRLPVERELAEQMGVSRPSVREAIQQLALRGMLEIVHGGGSIVKSLTEHEIRTPIESVLEEDQQKLFELAEVRAFMETWAARRAAIHRSEEELEQIRGFLEEMEQDLEKGYIRSEIGFKFHAAIASATRNTIFVHVIQSIHQLIDHSIRFYRAEIYVTNEDQATMFNHHLRVFKAIQNHDPDAAEAAMSEHLAWVLQEYHRKVGSGSGGQRNRSSSA